MSSLRYEQIVDELERLSLIQSRERFNSQQGEKTANFGILFADAMINAIGLISIFTAFSEIITSISPFVWELGDLNIILFGGGLVLWICSQSLNDFKRLLPLWLRLVLRFEIGPVQFSDQSENAQKRRAYTLFIAGAVSLVIARLFQTELSTIITKIGAPFYLVIYSVAVGFILLGIHWLRLVGRDEEMEIFGH